MDEVDEDSQKAPRKAPETEEDGLPEAVLRRLETFVPELVRRTVAGGVGAVFASEEGIRRFAKEMPLPKEVAGYLATTAGATKDEVMRVLAREMREFLQTINLSEEIAKMLTLLSFEVRTEVRFIPNSEKYGGVEPDVSTSVRLKRNGPTKSGREPQTNQEASEAPRRARRRRLTRRGRMSDPEE